MIIKRKLFSKTSKEKREMAADNLDRTRKGVATIYGGLAGAGIAADGILASNFIKDEKHRGVDKQVIIHNLKGEKKLDKEFEKIRSTGDKVRELAKKRIKTGNPIVGLSNEIDINEKVNRVENIYMNNAVNKAHASEELTKKAAERLKDRISKKASKRNKKIAIGAAVVGTAVGLASNHKMKKNAEKLRAKKFPKSNPDEETYLGASEEFDDSKFARKSDKWLKERARYDGGLTDKEKENIKKNNKRLIAVTGVSGASIGLAKKLSLKRGLVGAGIGSATGAAIATAGHLHHKSEARKAREELKRRGKE